MRSLLIAAAIVSLTAASAWGYGAKPNDPSGFGDDISNRAGQEFGQQVAAETKDPILGDHGVGQDVELGRGYQDSLPNLPPDHP